MRRSPVLETLAVMLAVFALQVTLGVLGQAGALAASATTVIAEPWTLATSVYAHAGPGHLVANAVALAVVGPLVARRTTRPRFHAFFVATGVLAVFAELSVGGLLGEPPVVLGASGAVFALVGYMLSGNALTSALLDRVGLSQRAKLVVLAVVVVGLTVVTGSSRAALVAHAAGLAVGLVSGRLGVLDVTPGAGRESQQVPDL
ncbi:MAG: membrane associated rhomboid family serine protease [Natronomonas sp.]|jgi:membrane associated rhomboid family serine protease